MPAPRATVTREEGTCNTQSCFCSPISYKPEASRNHERMPLPSVSRPPERGTRTIIRRGAENVEEQGACAKACGMPQQRRRGKRSSRSTTGRSVAAFQQRFSTGVPNAVHVKK